MNETKLSPSYVKVSDLYKSSRIDEIELAAIEIEWNGFMIDVPYFDAQAAKARQDEQACRQVLSDELVALGVKTDDPDAIWASPKKLAELLHDQLKLPPSPYWGKGRVKVDDGERKLDRTALEWVLSRCVGNHAPARRCVSSLMELRRILSSCKYLEKLPGYVSSDGFVHPVCGPAGDDDDRVGALTGRFGMKNPEGQQIPRDKRKDLYGIRKGFIAPPGMLLCVRDYTALEVVIMANMAEWLFGDTLLLELTAPGQDIHAYNAHRVFGTLLNQRTPSGRPVRDYGDPALYKSDPELAWFRDAIKAVWYKLQYGGTVHGFATSLRDQSGEPVGRARAEEIVGALYEAVPSVPKWQSLVASLLRRDGGIAALDGRYVDYSQLIAKGEWGFDAACRGAQNLPMQGTGAHVIGCAMADALNCDELIKLGAIMELQVHDELRWRCPAANIEAVAGLTGEIMCGAFPLKNLRSSVGTGKTWDEAK